ncbi:hypothetical protein AAG570_001862 [Ranatra chinensis]|uniref:Uncharacterized protein n=1 Tax=Ranatra chinensis TaxID=642074 RepID=A0ABD0YLM9_9HEMI
MASKRRNMFQKNKTQETTENGIQQSEVSGEVTQPRLVAPPLRRWDKIKLNKLLTLRDVKKTVCDVESVHAPRSIMAPPVLSEMDKDQLEDRLNYSGRIASGSQKDGKLHMFRRLDAISSLRVITVQELFPQSLKLRSDIRYSCSCPPFECVCQTGRAVMPGDQAATDHLQHHPPHLLHQPAHHQQPLQPDLGLHHTPPLHHVQPEEAWTGCGEAAAAWGATLDGLFPGAEEPVDAAFPVGGGLGGESPTLLDLGSGTIHHARSTAGSCSLKQEDYWQHQQYDLGQYDSAQQLPPDTYQQYPDCVFPTGECDATAAPAPAHQPYPDPLTELDVFTSYCDSSQESSMPEFTSVPFFQHVQYAPAQDNYYHQQHHVAHH